MIITSLSEYQDVIAETTWNHNQEAIGFSRVYYIQGGEAYYQDADVALRFKKGYIYFLPVGKNYMLWQNPKDPINHIFFHITTYPKITRLIEIKVEDDSFLENSLLLLKKEIRNSNFELILKLIDLIVSIANNENFINIDSGAVPKKIREKIDMSIGREFNLEALIKEIHYSKNYIINIFKKVYSITPMQYYLKRRMETALLMLREGIPHNVISEKLKFSSPANFSLAFKKYYGLSPTAYLDILKIDKNWTKTED